MSKGQTLGAYLLQEWREKQGLSQVSAAARLGYSASMYCKLEQGGRGPGLVGASRLEAATGIPARSWTEARRAPRSRRKKIKRPKATAERTMAAAV